MFTLGMDIGYSNMKLVYGSVQQKPLTVEVLPVGAVPEEMASDNIFGSGQSGEKVLVGDQSYVVGLEPDSLSNWCRALHDDYPSSLEYHALFHAALKKTGQQRIDCLVTGLPVFHFKEEKTKETLRKKLRGSHEISPGYFVHVEKIEIVPQPAGSYLDVATSAGRDNEFANSEILIIDPGFFSVDWMYMSGKHVQSKLSGTSTLATSCLLEEADALIYADYNHRVSPEKLERLLREGQSHVFVCKKQVLISEVLDRAAAKLCPQVMNHVQASMRTNKKDIDIIVLTGGGASLYRKAIEEIFPDVEIILPERSVEANARGFWYYGVED